jgi:hypothetical protein
MVLKEHMVQHRYSTRAPFVSNHRQTDGGLYHTALPSQDAWYAYYASGKKIGTTLAPWKQQIFDKDEMEGLYPPDPSIEACPRKHGPYTSVSVLIELSNSGSLEETNTDEEDYEASCPSQRLWLSG